MVMPDDDWSDWSVWTSRSRMVSVHCTRLGDGRVSMWIAPPGNEQYSHDAGIKLEYEPSADFRVRMGFQVPDEDERIHTYLKLPLMGYLSVDFGAGYGFSARLRRLLGIPEFESRDVSVHLSDGSLFWNLWQNPHESSSTDPWWKHGILDPLDVLFGRMEQTSDKEVASRVVDIHMPEGKYSATVRLSEPEYRRSRWPFKFGPDALYLHQRYSAQIEVADGGIPIPGKGENSWDCGDDAIYGLSCQADSIEDAIGKIIASALRTRMKRCFSYSFVPSEASNDIDKSLD